MSTFTERTFTQVFADARSIGLLNDPVAGGSRYPDSVLLPHGQQAFSKIQRRFAEKEIPLLERVIDTPTYTALAETIPIPAAITDLREPVEIWERDTNDSLWWPMRQVANLRPPFVTPLTKLYWWEWLNGAIRVLPCSTNRNIFMRYRRQLPYPAAATLMGFEGIYDVLVPGTAYYAATSRPDVERKAGALFIEALESIAHIASKGRQEITYRRRAWNDYETRPRVTMEPTSY